MPSPLGRAVEPGWQMLPGVHTVPFRHPQALRDQTSEQPPHGRRESQVGAKRGTPSPFPVDRAGLAGREAVCKVERMPTFLRPGNMAGGFFFFFK